MNPTRIFTAIVICLVGIIAGAAVGFILGGLGICAMDPTLGVVGFSAFGGAAVAATVAFLWPKAWWVGAQAFSVPALLGVASGAATGEWRRVFGTGLCILAARLAAFVIHVLKLRHAKVSQ